MSRRAGALARLASTAYWKMSETFSKFIVKRRTFVILRGKVDTSHAENQFQVREYATNAGSILDIYKAIGRYNYYPGMDDDTRVAARLRRGMRFYAAFEGDRTIAYLWMHSNSQRFFTDVGLFIRKGTKDLWVQDVYVVPEKRGHRLFGDFIKAVIREYYPGADNLCSDVWQENEPSLRAHRHIGLYVMGSVKCTHIFRRILIRRVNVDGMEAYGYKCPRAVLLSNSKYKAFVMTNRNWW